MASDKKKKGFAFIFICFLLVDALASSPVNAPANLRGKIRRSFGQHSKTGKDFGKYFALPATQVLAKKSNKNRGFGGSGCSSNSNSSISHKNWKRSYETIGSCETTINVVRETQKSVDFVSKENVCFQTVQNHSTSYNILTCTSTTKRFIEHHTAVIEILKRVCKTIQTLTTISVTISTVINCPTTVQTTSSQHACVKTLKPASRNKRVLTSTSVCARRITSTCGTIKHVKRVHVTISQFTARTVICPKSNNHKSWSNISTGSKCAKSNSWSYTSSPKGSNCNSNTTKSSSQTTWSYTPSSKAYNCNARTGTCTNSNSPKPWSYTSSSKGSNFNCA